MSHAIRRTSPEPSPATQLAAKPSLRKRRSGHLHLYLLLLLLLLLLTASPDNVVSVLDRHALGHVVHLVHTHQPGRELKHVVAERDDDELGIFGPFLDVVGHDGDLLWS